MTRIGDKSIDGDPSFQVDKNFLQLMLSTLELSIYLVYDLQLMELYSDFSLCDCKDAISEDLRFEYLMDGY